MSLNDHSSRAHALLSASSSSRWLVCPPSAVYASTYPNTDTDYTREGTRAHEVAEAIARADWELGFHSVVRLGDAGIQIPGLEAVASEVTEEMVRCAEGYSDHILELITDDNAVVLLEQRLDFSPWVPDGFGTGDCIIIQGHRLDVVDYKYGQGVAVAVEGNSQMRLYGLGALNDFGDIYDIHEVVMHIHQPRMNNVVSSRMSAQELLAWGEEVKPIAALAAKGKGEACAGEHCRFCPHAGACPTLSAQCMRVVNAKGGTAAVPTLAPWMVADVLKLEPMITAWLKAVKARALSVLLEGGEVPGYKAVEGRGSREWRDEASVYGVLTAEGRTPDEFTTKPVLLSPHAMEQALGKKYVAGLLSELIVSKPGSPTVAPESDKRKPLDRLAEARKDFE